MDKRDTAQLQQITEALRSLDCAGSCLTECLDLSAFDPPYQELLRAFEVKRTETVSAFREELAQSELYYRMLHSMIKSGMWSMTYDAQGVRTGVEWSDEFRRMLGYRDETDFPNELESWLDVLHPEERTAEFRNIWNAVHDTTGKTRYDVEYRLETRDRGYRWFHAMGDVARRPDGSPIRFFGVFVDITERKERAAAEEAARRERESLRILHGMLNSGPWYMDFDERGNMTSVTWSDTFRHMLGYESEKDFPNTMESWSGLLHKDDRERVLREYNDTVHDYTGQKTYDVEYRLLTKNRGWRWFHAVGRLSRRPDGSPVTYVGMFVDITEQKELEQKLEKQQNDLMDALAQARRANRAKTAFLNNMSHDIRTPMNAIIGFTALATTHMDNREIVEDYLKKIMTSSNHLLSLINDVLDMSRIESGKVKIDEKECSLPDIMHDLKTIVQADIHSKQLEFFIDTLDVVDEEIVCDKLRLNQVLLNVLSNAMKFTKPGGMVSVRVAQKPHETPGRANYEFRVRDTGIGMSKEFQKHIFEPFERERTSTVSGIQGTGLGMAITKNIVDMMNGTIEVESEEGKGTEFIITLPLRVSGKQHRVERVPELEGLRALIADDDYNTCASVTRMLQSIGMRSDWTSSGKEAVLRTKLALEQGDEFSAYIIDWLMPDMNGIETVRRIRKLIGDGKPIIILTAYDYSEVEEEAREAGVTAFCSKPLFLSELRETLLTAQGVQPDEAEPQPEAVSFEGKKLLLVEDNMINQEIAGVLLTEMGFALDTASDGSIAVEMMRSAKPGQYDLILMDVQMPVMNGYEATRAIRALPDPAINQIPIIAMTANAFEEDRQTAIDAGMNGHVAKPIDIERLTQTLSDMLKYECGNELS